MNVDALPPDVYYRLHFPWDALAQLATLSTHPLEKREFAAEGVIYKRFIEAASARDLKAAAVCLPELASLHIGAIYDNGPALAGKKTPGKLSVPICKEMIFDIDITDNDLLDLTQPNGAVDLKACDRAWPHAAVAVFFLQAMLRDQFGYSRFLLVYSGRRGCHLWVLDERARTACDEVRAAVASFVTVSLTPGPHARATRNLLDMVKPHAYWDAVEYAFEELFVSTDYFESVRNIEEFVARLALTHDGARNLADDAACKETPAEVWAYIKRVVTDISRLPKQRCVLNIFKETILAYVWPRIDFNVTSKMNHILKTPWVAHPKTGRIAVPIDPKDYWRFTPSSVPSLSNLGPDFEAYADLKRWIWKDESQLEMWGGAPRRARKFVVRRRDEADVEDLVPPPARAPQRPRSARFERKVSPLVPENMATD